MIAMAGRHLLSRGRMALLWLTWIVPMALTVGSACALFLWSLDVATRSRFEHPWLLFLLPVAGLSVGLVYHYWGRSAEGGNNLILEQIHEPGGGVPRCMAPLILAATVITHLFGGSAGREGTAVQMGGSIAGGCCRLFRLASSQIRILLMTGIAAGFGAVFGTPIAGAVFALEVLMVGRMQYESLIPCLLAAILSDWTCHAWGVGHLHYKISYLSGLSEGIFHLDAGILARVAIVGIAAGLVGAFFSETTHTLHAFFKKLCPYAPLRPAIGGILVIALVYLVGTREYLGLGVWSPNPHDVTISNLFRPDNIHYWAWAWKILFTAVTLSSGFKGGEVTPLFFIGAALGNALSGVMGGPTDLLAALGFVAIFAGASNTPLASTIMGIELFGAQHGVYIATACFLAYLSSGHSGIYLSQRIGTPKTSAGFIPPDASLREVRAFRYSSLALMTGQLRNQFFFNPPTRNGKTAMSHKHHVHHKETGMIRIYLKPSERRKGKGVAAFLTSRPLYRELVLAAKDDGIVNAVAQHAHYGYSNHDKVQAQNQESPNPELSMYVELMGSRDQLENYCRRHGDLLQNKVIIYKHLEHWEIHGSKLKESEATPAEINAGKVQ